nr:phosphonoacetaldehyde reductase [Pseudomaricurvus alkylphenolicus]
MVIQTEVSFLADFLLERNIKNVLLVTGKDSYSLSGARKVFNGLLKPFSVVHFQDFSVNPAFSEAQAGSDLCRENRCQAIISVGGGSSIDVAKSINAFQAHPERALDILRGDLPLTGPLLPSVAVPTTAGTGSEATHFAVLYFENRKYSLASPMLLPDVAVLDPVFTESMTPYISACCGFDALSQAIESYWAKSATGESRQFAQESIEILLKNLPLAVNSPTTQVRENMMQGAHLSGKAINISKTTAPHALSYTITSKYGLPHGHAVALTLGSFFELHESLEKDEAFEQRHHVLMSLMGVESGGSAKAKWYKLMNDCGLEYDLRCLKIGEHERGYIVDQVNIERLSNHPVELSKSQLFGAFGSIPCKSGND